MLNIPVFRRTQKRIFNSRPSFSDQIDHRTQDIRDYKIIIRGVNVSVFYDWRYRDGHRNPALWKLGARTQAGAQSKGGILQGLKTGCRTNINRERILKCQSH